MALKPIYCDDINLKDRNHVFWTKKINKKIIFEQSHKSFEQTINFIQSYSEKFYEVRITIVNENVFSAKIDSQFLPEDKGKVDWRQGYDYGLKYSSIIVPSKVETFCINFLKCLNLNFGCFDFIVNHENEYIFLECNPNGQWLWLEYELDLQVSKAIANSLIERKSLYSEKVLL